MTLVDVKSRCLAMSDFTSLFLVEAAAGTGKTSLMAGRVAMMLASGHQPDEIAAITFTEPAASELARRIRLTIDDLLADRVPDYMQAALPNRLGTEQKTALKLASARLDELTATTIHGFCQGIIRSHGVEAGLDPGARIVDAPLAEGLFLDVLSTWFARLLSDDGDVSNPVAVLAEQVPLKVLDLVRDLATLRRKHPDARAPRPDFAKRPDLDFGQAVDDFVRWQTGVPHDKWAAAIGSELQSLAAIYSGVFTQVPDFASLWRLRDPGRCRIFEKKKDLQLLSYALAASVFGAHEEEGGTTAALQLYAEVDRTWQELIGHVAAHLVWAMSSSLDDMLEAFAERKRAAAILDFDDLLIHARTLVRDHEEVRQAVGRRYKFILVDEFQDTDRVQAEILFSIAAWTRPSPWHEAVLRPGSLFLVGDPKQAIYRFRGADVEAYALSRRLIEAQPTGAILDVTANFRSQRAIIEHVNACFDVVLSTPSQPGYVALSATVPDRDYGVESVTRLTVEIDGKVYADRLREAEATRVAELCDRLIGNVEVVRPDKSITPLRAGDIALLSPSHADLWRYERALELRGLAVSSQAGQALMRRQETQDVLALLRVLADSSDTLAFGALMRGPLVGLSDQELLDISAALPESTTDLPVFFNVRTDPEQVGHALARAVLIDLQDLRKRTEITTPSLLLAEAIERLNARVIMAARYRNRNARALVNLDAIIERARRYAVSGLRAFVHDFQSDWERRTKVSEGRIDASEDAVEFVTIHSAKGLEWPVVIPINSTTELFRPEQFVYRQSDNSLHWMIGGVAPPELASARAEEGEEEARQRERIWYVACTRARDLLILPNLPQAAKASWFNAVDLHQDKVKEIDLSGLPENPRASLESERNGQDAAAFAAEAALVAASAPPLNWVRPSDHDPDRTGEAIDPVVVVETIGERIEAVGAGTTRGVVLHKLMEELLTGELSEPDVTARASELLAQLDAGDRDHGAARPGATEMGATALRTLALPEIAGIRSHLAPETPVWAEEGSALLAGRADALLIRGDVVEVAFDWKSDVQVSPTTRAAHVRQLERYLLATGARRGAVVYMSVGEIVWIGPALRADDSDAGGGSIAEAVAPL